MLLRVYCMVLYFSHAELKTLDHGTGSRFDLDSKWAFE